MTAHGLTEDEVNQVLAVLYQEGTFSLLLADKVAAALMPDVVCQHGVAMDVHCCGCHSGFLFDSMTCTCLNRGTP